MVAEVTQDNDRALGGKKEGEPCAKVSSDYGDVSRKMDNLKAFTRGCKTVVQEGHRDVIIKTCGWSPRSWETLGNLGEECSMEHS